jgi:hypothetical protein
MGLAAAGRPSNTGGAKEAASLLKHRPVILVGENDPKPNGRHPGKEGADSVEQKLARIWKRPVPVAYPPDGQKDLRDWVKVKLEDNPEVNPAELGRELMESLLPDGPVLLGWAASRKGDKPTIEAWALHNQGQLPSGPVFADQLDPKNRKARDGFVTSVAKLWAAQGFGEIESETLAQQVLSLPLYERGEQAIEPGEVQEEAGLRVQGQDGAFYEKNVNHENPKEFGLWRTVQTERGPASEQLSNFVVRIRSETYVDDGLEQELFYDLEAVYSDRREQQLSLPASNFDAMSWVAGKLGASAILCPGERNKGHFAMGVKLLSNPIKRLSVYTHTGWRQIGGRHVYLHAGGAIGAEGSVNSVETRLSGSLRLFELPEIPEGQGLQDAIRASLGILELLPRSICLPI